MRKHYRTILSMNDDDDVRQGCTFVVPSDKIKLLKLDRFPVEYEDNALINEGDDEDLEQASKDIGETLTSSAVADQQNPASEIVQAKVEEGVSRVLEQWTLENFRNFVTS